MTRRAIALGAGLIILILIILGVKGCLDARKTRALTDYSRDVSQVIDETRATSKGFFQRLEDPGKLSVTDFTNEVSSDRSAMEGYLTRVQKLSVPGDMSDPQKSLELVYELRAKAFATIANRMSTALGNGGRKRAIQVIANQMQVLSASDVLYGQVTRPEINAVLADNGITGDDVPKSIVVTEPSKWIDASNVGSALGQVSGSSSGSAADDNLTHGTGLISTAIGGSTLTEGVPVTVSSSSPTVDVQVQNQGEAEESGIKVSVTVDGGKSATRSIDTLGPGETGTASIPLTPAPTGEVQLEVEVEPLPGEALTDNNKATYTVTFQ